MILNQELVKGDVRYFQVSEPIMRDLLACKSKVEDIKLALAQDTPFRPKQRLVQQLTNIVNDKRYRDKDGEYNV